MHVGDGSHRVDPFALQYTIYCTLYTLNAAALCAVVMLIHCHSLHVVYLNSSATAAAAIVFLLIVFF